MQLVCRDIIAEIGCQFRRVDDADVVQQPDGEASYPGEPGYLGVEQPAALARWPDVAFGQRVFLAQQVVSQQSQLQLHPVACAAVHAENVDETFAVLRFVLPCLPGKLHRPDARGFE